MSTLIVIAKAPVPGRVKTRLTPAYTPEQAARLAEESLVDTLQAVLGTPADHRLLILDGTPDDAWLPSSFTVIPQVRGGLDRRLAAAFQEAADLDGGPALLVGMDTPQITPRLLAECWPGTGGEDAVLGPASDGGFWALGFRRPRTIDLETVLFDVPMSRPETGALQWERLRAAHLRTRLVAELCDVDTAEDAALVAARYPDTRFAAQLRSFLTPVRTAR